VTRRLEVEGRAVRVSHRPAEAGAPTVVLLHGYPDTLQIFARVTAALPAATGYVALDFPGQGQSEPSRVPTASPEARAGWLVQVLEALAVDRCSLMAHDMGAHAALELARLDPRRVARVVLAHALLDGTAATSRAIAVLRRARAYRVLLPAFPRATVARSVATFLPRERPLSTAIYEDIAAAFTSASARNTVAACDAAEEWLQRGLARFASLPMPLTLLWGDAEAHFPRVHAERLAAIVAQARLIDVAGGWHWLAWQDPGCVVAALAKTA
jgi:pimeloyl-ACP methyl ester carboxylesterase